MTGHSLNNLKFITEDILECSEFQYIISFGHTKEYFEIIGEPSKDNSTGIIMYVLMKEYLLNNIDRITEYLIKKKEKFSREELNNLLNKHGYKFSDEKEEKQMLLL